MRRGQSTLEYAVLIGIVAASIIAMNVYMKRGFQGNLRSLSDQVSAVPYSPGNTVVNNSETKHLQSTTVSSSTTTGTSTISSNSESGTLTVNGQTDETLGSFSNDSWH